jgi:hypothetical protein
MTDHPLVPSLELKPTLAKVGKMLAMLGSDNETDRMAAATAIYNVTKRTGLTPLQLWQMGLAKKEAELKALAAAMLAKDVNLLLLIGQEQASFFLNDAVFADVEVRGHRTAFKVESKAFEKWLLHRFFVETEKAPARSAIKSAIRTLGAIAEFGPSTPRCLVNLRTAEVDGRIYIDLCNDQQQCVEVNENGWRLIDASPVRFRRTESMRALPVPQHGGNIEMLRQFTNLNTSNFVLFVAALLDAFRSGKHPILNLVGEFGTAKSTLAKHLRSSLILTKRNCDHCRARSARYSSRCRTLGCGPGIMSARLSEQSATPYANSRMAAVSVPGNCTPTMMKYASRARA